MQLELSLFTIHETHYWVLVMNTNVYETQLMTQWKKVEKGQNVMY